MIKNKKFDCVKMKWDIQKEISKEFSGIPDEQANKMQLAKIEQNPILGPFYKKMRLSKETPTK